MKVLGIRNSPTKIRFCILEGNSASCVFVNQNAENKIDLPKALKTDFEIYNWVRSEFERVFDKYGPFDYMAIKQNENVSSRYSSLKPVMFMDCIAIMTSIKNDTSFSSHVYNSIDTNKKESTAFAETKVAKTSANWDSQIADAVACAFKNLK